MKSFSPLVKIIVAALAGILCAAIISLVAAFLIGGGSIPETAMRYASLLSLLAGGLLSGIMASRGGGKLPASAGANAVMAGLLFLLGKLWNGMIEPGYILINCAVLAASAVAGAVIGGRK